MGATAPGARLDSPSIPETRALGALSYSHRPLAGGEIKTLRRSIMAMDLVCNMEVDEATAQWTTEYKGQTYYFCAPGCKKSFDDDPERYVGGSGSQEGHMDHDHGAH